MSHLYDNVMFKDLIYRLQLLFTSVIWLHLVVTFSHHISENISFLILYNQYHYQLQ